MSPAALDRNKVRWRLQVNVALLGVLGTWLLGAAQDDYLLPLAAFVAAALSLWITDRRGWFHLHGLVANAAALTALGFSIYDFRTYEPDRQLLAIANLLVYLQIVLLFQDKHVRIYWQLIMLSLLQVVVAAALSLGVIFGVILLIYLVAVLRAMALLLAFRETLRFAAPAPGIDASAPVERPRRPGPCRIEDGAAGAILPVVSGRSLIRGLGLWTCGAVAVAIGVFLLAPRVKNQPWYAKRPPSFSIGFNPEITLGELGPIAQDPEVVMQVRLRDAATGKHVVLQDEPLFRGQALTGYNVVDRSWYAESRGGMKPLPLPELAPGQAAVRQQFTMLLRDQPVSFSIFPPARLNQDATATGESTAEGIQYNPAKLRMTVPAAERRNHRIAPTFELATTGIQIDQASAEGASLRGSQLTFLPDVFHDLNRRSAARLASLTDAQAEKLPKLIATAAQVVRSSGLPEEDPLGRARALENYLRYSEDFSYSLIPPQRDTSLDPMEDFISNNPSGHCEYFASALVMMCRSQGIPARMIVGFKCSEWNPYDSFYQVRQLHAHAWVEVGLRREHLPVELQLDPRYERGAWMTLDPVPSYLVGTSQFPGYEMFARLRALADYVQVLWTYYVVNVSSTRHKEPIYHPLVDMAKSIGDDLRSDAEDAPPWRSLADWSARQWLSPHGLGVALGMAAMAALLGTLIFRAVRAMGRAALALRRRAAGRRTAPRVEFYRRLERLLARDGLHRRTGQTPHEFARAAGGHLAERAATAHLAGLPRRITEAYYEIRFGGHALADEQQQDIGRWLVQLTDAMDRGRLRRRANSQGRGGER